MAYKIIKTRKIDYKTCRTDTRWLTKQSKLVKSTIKLSEQSTNTRWRIKQSKLVKSTIKLAEQTLDGVQSNQSS